MSNEMENLRGISNTEYATKDLYFASFLHLKGVELKRLEKLGRGRRGLTPVYFVFNDRQRCELLEDRFWSGVGEEVIGNIKDYYTALRDLRARAFSITRVVNDTENSWGEVVEENHEGD
jgi:hypothetical protein